MTPEDVIFSFEAFKANSPFYGGLLPACRQGREDRRARDHLHLRRPGQSRTAADRRPAARCCRSTGGKAPTRTASKRDVTATTLEPPLGSGPYRIKEFTPGRTIVYERVKDYWGRDLNVNIGRNNFDEMRFDYFRDSTVALEAFKGDQIDWRTENSAKNWATAYDFPAVSDKRVIKEEFPDPQSRRDAGLRVQHRGATNSRIRACAGRSISRSISRR